jgi:hypothetical protein
MLRCPWQRTRGRSLSMGRAAISTAPAGGTGSNEVDKTRRWGRCLLVRGAKLPVGQSGQMTAMCIKRRAWSRGSETRDAGRATGDRSGARLHAIIALIAVIRAWRRRKSRLGHSIKALVVRYSGTADHNDHAEGGNEKDREGQSYSSPGKHPREVLAIDLHQHFGSVDHFGPLNHIVPIAAGSKCFRSFQHLPDL